MGFRIDTPLKLVNVKSIKKKKSKIMPITKTTVKPIFFVVGGWGAIFRGCFFFRVHFSVHRRYYTFLQIITVQTIWGFIQKIYSK